MANHLDRTNRPVLKIGGVVAAASAIVPAVLALVVAFGVTLTDEQTAAILGLIAAISAVVPVAGAKQAEKRVSPINDPFRKGSGEEDEG